ncbi:MAG: hypothetical protein II304_03595 [Bacteroidales bacterium]|nr:hypothetical protein [Bacteroidales bacterium]
MDNKKIVYNDTFDIANYLGTVKTIVDGFFSGGEYNPAYGKINTMRLFHNFCITDSPFDVPDEIVTDMDMNVLLESNEFLQTFEDMLNTQSPFTLTFGNAYREALDIVETRKSGLGQVTETIKSFVMDFIDGLNNSLSADNIARLEKIAENVQNGDLSADSIVAAFGKAQFK